MGRMRGQQLHTLLLAFLLFFKALFEAPGAGVKQIVSVMESPDVEYFPRHPLATNTSGIKFASEPTANQR